MTNLSPSSISLPKLHAHHLQDGGIQLRGERGHDPTDVQTLPRYFDGVFGRNRAIQPKELQDGLTKTLAVGERASRWSRPALWGVVPNSKILDNQKPGLYAAGPAFVLGTTFNEGFNIESGLDEMDHGTIGTFAESYGSNHPGGASSSFAMQPCDLFRTTPTRRS